MDLSLFFTPINVEEDIVESNILEDEMIATGISFYNAEGTLDLEDVDIAIFGVQEARNSYRNNSCAFAPNEIRRQFYTLYQWNKPVNIVDLGNIIIGKTAEDTYSIVSEVIAYLIENNTIPILLGGSNDLAYANYRAYEQMEQVVNIVAVDSRFDLGKEEISIRSDAYLNKIVLQQPNYLLNYANIGYQTYMNSPSSIELMSKLFFETYRVGMMRKDMEEVEPIVRNAEMVSIDISAVRHPDAPGNPHASANGFYGEEICQIARFAGVSDKLTSFGIYEYDPTLDYNNQTSQLISHLLWYFIEGFLNRQGDSLFKDKNNYFKHSVTVSDAIDELVFYCSKKTGRWWVIVPVINATNNIEQKYFLPCSRKDYDTACKDVIPERWWRAYHKLNR